jgi:hypothetical protein
VCFECLLSFSEVGEGMLALAQGNMKALACFGDRSLQTGEGAHTTIPVCFHRSFGITEIV